MGQSSSGKIAVVASAATDILGWCKWPNLRARPCFPGRDPGGVARFTLATQVRTAPAGESGIPKHGQSPSRAASLPHGHDPAPCRASGVPYRAGCGRTRPPLRRSDSLRPSVAEVSSTFPMPLPRPPHHDRGIHVWLLCVSAVAVFAELATINTTGSWHPLGAFQSKLTAASALAQVAAVGPIPCLDLPMSSALITPSTCWQTGPTTTVMAGTDPRSAADGVVAVVEGQAQSLQVVPGSGPLAIVAASGSGACTLGGGKYRMLDLADGRLGPGTTQSCRQLPNSNGIAAAPATTLSPPRSSPNSSAGSVPPSVSPSYYEDYAYLGACSSGATTACPLYRQGQATYTPSPPGLVILDFGAPCYVTTAQNVYGTEMFGGSACVPNSAIHSLLEDWIAGYESDHGAGTTSLTLAAGTSNSLNGVDPGYSLTNAQMQVAGQDWYQQVVAATNTSGMAAPLSLWGGSDMEQSSDGNWYQGTPTVAWVNGYASASPARYSCSQGQPGFLADYGDDILGGSGTADGWTVSQVYQVAWGTPVACSVPEIYYPGMAPEWAALSQWGNQNAPSTGAISFTGVMTEAGSGSYTPTQGWIQLQQATGQSPPTLTTIGTALQGQPPQVDAVSPNQGPVAGGTSVTITGANLLGAQAVYFGSNPALAFTPVSANQITATAPAGTAGFSDVVVETALGASSPQGTDGFIYSTAGAYHPLQPSRIEDTRAGSGLPGSGQPPGPGGILNVQVAGSGGVPATGVAAVLVNLTVTSPTAAGFVTAFPTGVPVPGASTVDFQPGETKANLAVVTLGRSGQISVYNAYGSVDVVIDVEGWSDAAATSSGGELLNSVSPRRIADTRAGSGYPYAGQTLGSGQSLTVRVAGAGGIPSTGADAVVVNVTETNATSPSFLTIFPAGAAQPMTSNLNFEAGQTAANQVVAQLGPAGAITIYNAYGSVDVVVDVAGWFGGQGSGSALHTVVPARALDTRPGSGEPYATQTLSPDGELTVQFAGLAGVSANGATGLAINVTVTNTRAAGYLSVAPAGQPLPDTSEVNWVTGQTTENLVITGVGPNESVTFYNCSTGSVDLVVDVYGWYG